MNYYISNGTFYTVTSRSNELYHYGVPGMKWGRRKARPVVTGGIRKASGTQAADPAVQREARKAKLKKAAKIGAAVAAAGLAAYGAYKLDKTLKSKAYAKAYKRGQKAIEKYHTNEAWNGLMSSKDPWGYGNKVDENVRKMRIANRTYASNAASSTRNAIRELRSKDPTNQRDIERTTRALRNLAGV